MFAANIDIDIEGIIIFFLTCGFVFFIPNFLTMNIIDLKLKEIRFKTLKMRFSLLYQKYVKDSISRHVQNIVQRIFFLNDSFVIISRTAFIE